MIEFPGANQRQASRAFIVICGGARTEVRLAVTAATPSNIKYITESPSYTGIWPMG